MQLVAKSSSIGTVIVNDDELEVQRPLLNWKQKNRRLSIAEIADVEFEPATTYSKGWVRFHTSRQPTLSVHTAKGGRRRAAFRDDLAVLFTKSQQHGFEQIADYVRRRILDRLEEVAVPETFEQISFPAIFEPVSLVEPGWTGGLSNVDTGRLVIDTERAAFVGAKESRTWTYASIVGVQHEDDKPMMLINVQERERWSGVAYREEVQTALWKTFQLAADHVLDARTTTVNDSDDRLSKLERLGALRQSGVLTEEEFEAEKARLLGSGAPVRSDHPPGSSDTPTQVDTGT